jgi:putative transposase
VPPALQQQVHAEVEKAKERSGWPARRTLRVLGIARGTYYRWLREEAWARAEPKRAVRPVQPYEALAQEKAAVKAYALAHPELRHRELAWRMVDEDVAYVSPSTVYRILKTEQLVCPWRRRSKRRREEEEKASRPNQRWASDLMYLQIKGRTYYFISFLDEYSRYIVHHELLRSMDGPSVSLAALAAMATLPRGANGQPQAQPEIRTDNGSGYVSQEFRQVL